MKYFLQSTTKPENRFEILKFDKATGVMKLKGQYATFDEKMDKERMERYKYEVVKDEGVI